MQSHQASSSGLTHELSNLEAEFLDSIINGPEASEKFLTRFSELHHLSLRYNDDRHTATIAQTVASNIASMAKSFAEVESYASSVGMKIDNALSDCLQALSLDDVVNFKTDVVTASSTTMRTSAATTGGRVGKTPLSIASETWLIEHIYKPFPPLDIKKKIVDESRCSWKALDDWFTSARRKIGWTAFSKRHFKGNRCLTLDCAHRVMVKGKGQEYSEEIRRDLEEIKATAERLYGSSRINNDTDASSFAKELESIEAQTSVSSSKSRKRRLSTSSRTTDHSSSSCPSTSSSSSRKRSRASSEESDTTCYSESSDTDSHRASKRARSVSPAYSCTSQESSGSSDSADTVSEISTPTISPTYPSFPVEIIDNWIDGVSAEPIFLPYDIIADGPQLVFSQKRRSPDLESDAPTKRARLDGPQTLPSEKSDNPISESRPIASAAQAVLVQPSPVRSLSEEPAGWSPVYGAPVLQPSTELDEETMDFLLSQMDFNIPQAAVPDWGQDILKSVIEVCPFDFSSIDLGIGSSIGFPGDTGSIFANSLDPCSLLPASGGVLPDVHSPVVEKQPESGDATSASILPNDPTTSNKDQSAISEYFASTPLSLTSEELEFLESLGNASQPSLSRVGSGLANDGKAGVPLIDFVHPSVEPARAERNELANVERPQLANQLLEEARVLQQEVFG